jgi:transposase
MASPDGRLTNLKAALPRRTPVWCEAADNGQDQGQAWSEPHVGWTTPVVHPPPRRVRVAAPVEPTPRPAFTVRPRRWVVERPCAWLGQNRRLSNDDERLCETSATMV